MRNFYKYVCFISTSVCSGIIMDTPLSIGHSRLWSHLLSDFAVHVLQPLALALPCLVKLAWAVSIVFFISMLLEWRAVVVVAPHASLNLQIAVGKVGFCGAPKN